MQLSILHGWVVEYVSLDGCFPLRCNCNCIFDFEVKKIRSGNNSPFLQVSHHSYPKNIPFLKLTQNLKIDGWNMLEYNCSFRMAYFQGWTVSFRQGIFLLGPQMSLADLMDLRAKLRIRIILGHVCHQGSGAPSMTFHPQAFKHLFGRRLKTTTAIFPETLFIHQEEFGSRLISQLTIDFRPFIRVP